METFSFEDIYEGMSATLVVHIKEADIDTFAKLTGDVSPLHMDQGFSNERGFSGRVAHGALLNGYISHLCGVHLPGQNCLLQSIKSNFLAPVIADDEIEFVVKVKQISEAADVVIATTSAVNFHTGQEVMRGQVQFGFTQR
ncbi:MAG: MaoC family dehydratase [Rhodospirillales bacterium]|nr:MaoC family dehydratase [Rhodospirillales bacterium]